MCCRCCELGVQAGRHHEDCDPVPVLDAGCGEQFTNCCKKAKSCKELKQNECFFSLRLMYYLFFFSLVTCETGFEMGDNGRCHGMFYLLRLMFCNKSVYLVRHKRMCFKSMSEYDEM